MDSGVQGPQTQRQPPISERKGRLIFCCLSKANLFNFMDEVEILCDRIGILKDGGFAFEGTVEEAVTLSPYEKLEDAYLWFTGEEEEDNE